MNDTISLHLDETLRNVATGDQRTLLKALKVFSENKESSVRQLKEEPAFQVILHQLANSFLLVVPLDADDQSHRLIKFSYDEPFHPRYAMSPYWSPAPKDRPDSIERLAEGWRRLLRNTKGSFSKLAVLPTEVRFSTPAAVDAMSYHFEIEVPPGLVINDASLVAGRRHELVPAKDRTGTGKQSKRVLSEDPKAAWDRVRGAHPRVDLHVIEVPHGSTAEARVWLVADRRGWLGLSGVAALATAIALLIGVFNLDAITNPVQGVAGTLLGTLSALNATMLARTREHMLTSSVLSWIRLVAGASAMVSFVAVGVLIAVGDQQRVTSVWVVLTAVAWSFAGILVASWLRAYPAPRKVHSPWEQGEGLSPPSPPDFHYDTLAIEVPTSEGERFAFVDPTRRSHVLHTVVWDDSSQAKAQARLAEAIERQAKVDEENHDVSAKVDEDSHDESTAAPSGKGEQGKRLML